MDADLLDQARAVDPTVLGKRIREARLARNLTQTAVAGEHMSTAYISRIEAGQRRPDPELIEAIAARLGVDVGSLVTGTSRDVAAEQRLALDWAELSLRTGDSAAALDQVDAVLAQDPPADLRRTALRVKASTLENLAGHLDDAIILLEDLVAGDVRDTAWLSDMQSLSRCYRASGDLTRSIEVGERAASEVEALGIDGGDEAVTLAMSVAAAYFERGDTGHAARLVRRAVAQAERHGSPEALAKTYWNASIIESRNGRTAAAVPLARKALALLDAGEDARNAARLRTQLGLLQLRLDEPDAQGALDELRRAESELRHTDASDLDVASNRLHQARALYLLGRSSEARDLAGEVRSAAAPIVAAEAAVITGLTFIAEGRQQEAVAHYREAVMHLTSTGSDRGAAQLWFELASLMEQSGDLTAALDAYRRAGASTGLRSMENTVVTARSSSTTQS